MATVTDQVMGTVSDMEGLPAHSHPAAHQGKAPCQQGMSHRESVFRICICKYVSADRLELRCVVSVMRHGDRTPKQKMKLKLSDQSKL